MDDDKSVVAFRQHISNAILPQKLPEGQNSTTVRNCEEALLAGFITSLTGLKFSNERDGEAIQKIFTDAKNAVLERISHENSVAFRHWQTREGDYVQDVYKLLGEEVAAKAALYVNGKTPGSINLGGAGSSSSFHSRF